MKKITNIEIAKQLNTTPQSISNIKQRHPEKFRILKFGSYISKAKISEEELISFLNTYQTIKENIIKT